MTKKNAKEWEEGLKVLDGSFHLAFHLHDDDKNLTHHPANWILEAASLFIRRKGKVSPFASHLLSRLGRRRQDAGLNLFWLFAAPCCTCSKHAASMPRACSASTLSEGEFLSREDEKLIAHKLHVVAMLRFFSVNVLNALSSSCTNALGPCLGDHKSVRGKMMLRSLKGFSPNFCWDSEMGSLIPFFGKYFSAMEKKKGNSRNTK